MNDVTSEVEVSTFLLFTPHPTVIWSSSSWQGGENDDNDDDEDDDIDDDHDYEDDENWGGSW